MGPLLSITTPRHPTDSHNLIQLPPNPVAPEILTYEDSDDDDVEDPGLDDMDGGQEGEWTGCGMVDGWWMALVVGG